MVKLVDDRRPTAAAIHTKADIVFCVDATGSMDPCIEGVKSNISSFVEGLASAAQVDFRLRLIAYRDLHDPTGKGDPWLETDFTRSIDEFKSQLTSVKANGGGDKRDRESTLDALYRAVHSEWRDSRSYRTIALFTDDDTHAKLHESTYMGRQNDVYKLIQDMQDTKLLRHFLLFMVLPKYPTYAQIAESMRRAGCKVIVHWVPTYKEDPSYQGLKAVEWTDVMRLLGETVSVTSTSVR